MTSPPALVACRAFLTTVWQGHPPTDQELINALESLLTITASCAAPQTDHWKYDPPNVPWKETYTKAGERFPHLGLYHIESPRDGKEPLTGGDALDDIADITCHVREMIWYADTHNVDYALDYFAMYHWHWTEHAENLLRRLRHGSDGLTAPS